MRKLLHLYDPYPRECESTIVSIDDSKFVVLHQTILCPKGGGQLNDVEEIRSSPAKVVLDYCGEIPWK